MSQRQTHPQPPRRGLWHRALRTEGLCRLKDQPTRFQEPPVAGRRSWTAGFITGNAGESLGGAIRTASQKRGVAAARGGMSEVSLPLRTWHRWKGSGEGAAGNKPISICFFLSMARPPEGLVRDVGALAQASGSSACHKRDAGSCGGPRHAGPERRAAGKTLACPWIKGFCRLCAARTGGTLL